MLRIALSAVALCGLAACTQAPPVAEETAAAPAMTSLLDGKSLDGWNRLGTANWTATGEYVEATDGDGYLMTADSYKDFELHAEFWVDEPANSGIFVRCADRASVTADNAYEVNIYDKRPDPQYATGAIVNIAPPSQPMMAAGKWNTYDVMAQGGHLVVTLNGVKTVDVMDDKHAEGPIAIQRTAGIVRYRKIEVRPLS